MENVNELKDAPVKEVASTVNYISVKAFMLQQGFVSAITKVRKNTNDYPFVTFMNEANEATNIYFSKNASTMVAEGEVIARGFFDKFRAVLTTNADGEQRWKIGSQSDLRASIEDLF